MSDLVAQLPAVNALFNGLTAVCLLIGFAAIKARRRDLHRALMLSAFGCGAIFLIGYLLHTLLSGNTHFTGSGGWRVAYLIILFSHMALAVIVLPFILRTLYLALRGRFDKHRQVAVWTWPAWVYVSVTGVIVYLMLFQLPLNWLGHATAVVP